MRSRLDLTLRPWLAGLALTLALAPLAGPVSAQRAAVVGVDEVRLETISQTFPVIGRLVARKAGVVAARVGGPVDLMRVQVGDRVKVDQVLAVLHRNRLKWTHELRQADVTERAAELETARAAMKIVSQEVARMERLKKNRSAAFQQARYDDRQLELVRQKSAMAEAEARLRRARSNRNLARIDLEEAEIRAPYDGVVTLRHTDAGAYLKVGDPVVTLIADADLEIEADVPAGRLPGLAPETKVRIAFADGSGGEAVVRAVVPEENPLTRTRAVRFSPSFETSGGRFASNQSVTVEVPIGAARETLTVHKDAILNRGGKTLVFVAAEGKATPRPVELGEAVGGRYVVLAGLNAGEAVVVRGNERLRPGQPVSY
ncbi:MAG: efflux RND transporter periplasmic adaptor subunit [Alphaproteobacteria bacterium]|jgi:RND family efflux transporter MFP subunit|nr:efflux RND transporter periplasmic adaptor subunit [Alphaproteobacteria bacterium]